MTQYKRTTAAGLRKPSMKANRQQAKPMMKTRPKLTADTFTTGKRGEKIRFAPHNGVWYYSFTGADGRTVSRSSGTDDAEKAQQQAQQHRAREWADGRKENGRKPLKKGPRGCSAGEPRLASEMMASFLAGKKLPSTDKQTGQGHE